MSAVDGHNDSEQREIHERDEQCAPLDLDIDARSLEPDEQKAFSAVELIPFVEGSPPPLKSNEDAPPSKVIDGQERLIAERVQDHQANRALRNKYAGKAYDLACRGLVFWGLAISATGVAYGVTGRQMLSDSVLIAITAGATINVLAAFLGVIRGLFPTFGKEQAEARNEEG